MTLTKSIVPPAWEAAITAFLDASAGLSKNTLLARRQHLENAARALGEDPWAVSADQLVRWCAARNWARETRRGRRASFRAFWTWAVHAGRTTTNPALALQPIPAAHPAPRPTPNRIILAAARAADSRTLLMIRLAAECGLRRAEVAALHTDDVIDDLVGWTLRIVGKGGKQRLVPCPPGLAQMLAARPRGYVFPGDDNGHLSPRYVGKLVAACMPEGWTMHSLRHRAATDWYQTDRDTFTVQQLLGHASPATTQRYVRIPTEAMRRTVMAVTRDYGLTT